MTWLRRQTRTLTLALLSLSMSLYACSFSASDRSGFATFTPLPAPPPLSTATAVPPAPTALPSLTPRPGWEILAPGLELRVAWMWVSGVDGPVEITILRIDPRILDIRTHYGLDHPLTVAQWQATTGALALINGAFFEPGDTVLGLLVEEGLAHGEPFEDHGGMLTVGGSDADVRALRLDPVRPGEQFDYAIQGRPMLLEPGGIPADFDLSPEASRRTVIAQDRDGHILFLVNDYGAVSLYTLRDWLATTPDLNLNAAFNLDGGGSTGLALEAGGRSLLIDSWWEVATAVAIYPKTLAASPTPP